MRIIAGEWRGRPLHTPAGAATRPTADRVRETLFSMLTSRIGSFEGLRVADLYAGSGALGLEALSRGAGFACFVETDPKALAAIRDNLARFGVTDRARVLPASATSLRASEPFDLILADPPYGPGAAASAIDAVMTSGWLGPGGWMAIETERGDRIADPRLETDAERDVGPARLTLFRRP